MNSRTLAVGLVVSLVIAGCKTVTVAGDYDFADNPGKGLVAFSTRMNGDPSCPINIVTGTLGFRDVTQPDKGAKAPSPSMDAVLLAPREPREERPDSIIFDMRAPRPERKESTYSDMGGTQEVTIPAEPPTHFTVQEVPAGRYSLNSLVMVVSGDPRSPYKALRPPGFWFTVPEGQVVYLGELEVQTTWKNCVPMLDYMFWVRDEWERDEARFKARIPNIRPEAVRKRLLEKD